MVQGIQLAVKKYRIPHITISPYNSQADGLVERRHRDVREALMKTVGGEASQWYKAAPAVFWAERITIQKSTGYSPYYMAHGVEPLLPFDIVEGTYLAPPMEPPMETAELLAIRARQLEKRKEDLKLAAARVLASRFCSAAAFICAHAHTIRDYDFQLGDLVMYRNTQVEKEMNRKHKDRYLGPMVVVWRHKSGAYTLAELDGAVSKTVFGAFRVVPYYARVGHVGGDTPAGASIQEVEDSRDSDQEYEWVTGDEGVD